MHTEEGKKWRREEEKKRSMACLRQALNRLRRGYLDGRPRAGRTIGEE